MKRSKQTPIVKSTWTLVWTGLLATVLLNIPSARAQHERGEREIDAARERIHVLHREAEELQEAGRHDKADALLHEARRLEERLDRHREQRERENRHGDMTATLERLEQGMAALRELGRHDELERLEHIAAQLRERLSHQAEERRRADNERAADRRQRETARRDLKIMRYALEALAEAERPDAADLIERALRATEMTLEGRRDEEARHMRETAPNAAQQVELLALAAEILQDRGRGERAQAVGQLSRRMRERLHRDRPARHERGESMQRFMERVETLEQRMAGVERAMERIQDAIEGLKRDRD